MANGNGTVVVIDATRTRAAEKHVQERIPNGLCLACDPDVDGEVRKYYRRGLCVRCAARWETQMDQFGTEAEKAAFCAELIRQGLLLPDREVVALTAPNRFREIAKSIKGA